MTRGADVNAEVKQVGPKTPLEMAQAAQAPGLVQFLISHGAQAKAAKAKYIVVHYCCNGSSMSVKFMNFEENLPGYPPKVGYTVSGETTNSSMREYQG